MSFQPFFFSNFAFLILKTFSLLSLTPAQRYSTNPAVEWRSKDVAEYLVGALVGTLHSYLFPVVDFNPSLTLCPARIRQAIRKRTAAQGTTETNALLDVVDIFRSTILPDLQVQQEHDHRPCPLAKARLLLTHPLFVSPVTSRAMM